MGVENCSLYFWELYTWLHSPFLQKSLLGTHFILDYTSVVSYYRNMRTTDSSFTAHEDCEVFYCKHCMQTYTPQEVMATSRINSRNMLDWRVSCPECGEKMTADGHIQEHAVEDFSSIPEIEKVEEDGRVLRARISEETYDLDDCDGESLISRLRDLTGATYEWRDDYEPQDDGSTTVTLERA